MDRAPEPGTAGERELLLGWLAFHRDALAAKCDGLAPDDLVRRSAEPSDLSLLGLVRHMTEMERVYLVHGPLVYCTEERPDGDIVGLSADMVPDSFERWHAERRAADALLAGRDALDDRTRWNLVKVIQEYARHNGHADIIRERIDGVTGE